VLLARKSGFSALSFFSLSKPQVTATVLIPAPFPALISWVLSPIKKVSLAQMVEVGPPPYKPKIK
jgi:hypothetical protein